MPPGDWTAPAPLLGSAAGALLAGVREAARALAVLAGGKGAELEVGARLRGDCAGGVLSPGPRQGGHLPPSRGQQANYPEQAPSSTSCILKASTKQYAY